MSSSCPTCPQSEGPQQNLLLPAVNPDMGSPMPVPFDACPPNVTDSPMVCYDGYRLPLIAAATITAAELCKTFDLTVACAANWAYPGLLLEIHPFGFAQVTAVDGHVLSVQNLNIALNTPIPQGTAIRPIPRAPLDQNGFSVSDDELQDADEGALSQSVAFPIFEKVTACGASSAEQRFAMRARNRMCGIPLTSGADVSGVRLGLYVPTTGCFHFLPNGAEGQILRIVNGRPRWASDEQIFTFKFTGSDHIFTVPTGYSRIEIKLWGAGGMTDPGNNGGGVGYGGAGGFTSGKLNVQSGQRFRIVVGASIGWNLAGFGGGGRDDGVDNSGSYFNAPGGGLVGLFTDGDAIDENDAARALLIAGGGGGGGSSAGGAVNGGGGNNGAANQSTFRGASSTAAPDRTGGGGGGYHGGAYQVGGSGYAHETIIDPLITAASGSTVPNASDPDYGDSAGSPSSSGGPYYSGLCVIRLIY